MLDRLRLIFLRLRRGKLKLSPSKCEFIATKMMFLGSWISEKGYEADQNKVKAILNLPLPTSKKKVVHHDLLRYIQHALVEKMVNKYNYKLSVDVPDALTITLSNPAQFDNENDTLEELDDMDFYTQGMKKQYIPHQAPERQGEQNELGGEEPISDAEEMVPVRRSERHRRRPQWMNAYHY